MKLSDAEIVSGGRISVHFVVVRQMTVVHRKMLDYGNRMIAVLSGLD